MLLVTVYFTFALSRVQLVNYISLLQFTASFQLISIRAELWLPSIAKREEVVMNTPGSLLRIIIFIPTPMPEVKLLSAHINTHINAPIHTIYEMGERVGSILSTSSAFGWNGEDGLNIHFEFSTTLEHQIRWLLDQCKCCASVNVWSSPHWITRSW